MDISLLPNGKMPSPMPPHHQSAIEMAQVALDNIDNPQIKELAENIVSAQQREIEQMKQWHREWYPQS